MQTTKSTHAAVLRFCSSSSNINIRSSV